MTQTSVGPLLGGVVLGVGLAILPMALDRAELPSPIPSSLSWHQPDRAVAVRIGEYAQRRYIDLEVDLVEDLIRGRLDEQSQVDARAYLSQRGSAESIRQWAGSQEPRSELANALEDSFVVAPISWELEPGESVDTSFDELASLVDAEPVSDVPSLWLGVTDAELPDEEPPPEPAIVETPEPVVEEPVPDVEPEPTVLASAVTPVAPPPSPPRLEAGPREPSIAHTSVFIELSDGDSESVGPDVTGRLSQLVQCYENALEFQPNARGSVEFEWNIRLGRVNSLAVADDSLGDEIAVRCMSERIRRWRFEPTVSGLVSWRFSFESNPG